MIYQPTIDYINSLPFEASDPKTAKELGFYNGYHLYILVKCPKCLKLRRVKLSETKTKNYTGLCRSCCMRRLAIPIDATILKQMYVNQNCTIRDIARYFNVSSGVISRNLCENKIPIKTPHELLYKGGSINFRGYKLVSLLPTDFYYPMTNHVGYVAEHRLIMAQYLGRCLETWELVHHMGTKYPMGSYDDKHDNRIENLELKIASNHASLHHSFYKDYPTELLSLQNENQRLKNILQEHNILL